MNCEQYQSQLFYLAEDDPQSREILEEHFDACHDCSLKWHEYQTLLQAYDSVVSEQSPALAMPGESKFLWHLLRFAAVLLFGGLLALFWQKQSAPPVASIQKAQTEAMSWEPPSLHFSSTILDTKDHDFQERIHYLEDAIAALQAESSSNQF